MGKPGLKAYRYPGVFKPGANYLISILFLMIFLAILTESGQSAAAYSEDMQLSPSEKQLLLNGRIWRNQYTKAIGDPYFLSDIFLKGSVTYNGQKFNDLNLKYDIKNDELILQVESHPTIFINKEMVDSFNLVFDNINFRIINAGNDTSGILRGYVNVLYDGTSSLYVKYIKILQPLAVDGRYDQFFPGHHIFLKKGTEIVAVTGKRKFLELLDDKKREVRTYIKDRKLKITRKYPGTFIPVLKYYDSIQN